MRYAISDPHFGHENIINYTQRPYSTAEEMNESLIENWNQTVSEDDAVFLLGDVMHHPSPLSAEEWIGKLNGKILVVRGNHDSDISQNSPIHHVESCEIQHGRYSFYCEHQPLDNTGFWQLHGHSHRDRPFIDNQRKNANLSVDVIKYTPISMDHLIYYIEKGERLLTLREAVEKYGTPDDPE